MSSGGKDLPPLDMKQFIKMASETPQEEFEMDLKQILSEYPTWQKNNPNKTYDDFLEENGIRRVELKKWRWIRLKIFKRYIDWFYQRRVSKRLYPFGEEIEGYVTRRCGATTWLFKRD